MELRVVQALVSYVKPNPLNPCSIILNGALPTPLLMIYLRTPYTDGGAIINAALIAALIVRVYAD
jgi:hypothetical protein